MSVEGDYLICKYSRSRIYRLTWEGTLELTRKFLVLWRVFFPFGQRLENSLPIPYALPAINNLVLSGSPDEQGYINFRAVNFVPSRQSAVTADGIALNFFLAPNKAKLNFRVTWRASEDVKYVNFYFKNPAITDLRLNYDMDNNLSYYPKNRGEAVFQSQIGLLFCKCISTEENPSIIIEITAEPPSYTHLPKTGCLAVCDELIPLYRANIVYPEWQHLAELIATTIAITSLLVPITPIQDSSSYRLEVIDDQQTLQKTQNILDLTGVTYATFFQDGSVKLIIDGELEPRPPSDAIQDAGSSIQPVKKIGSDNYQTDYVKRGLYELFLFDAAEFVGESFTLYTAYEKEGSWYPYSVSLFPFNDKQGFIAGKLSSDARIKFYVYEPCAVKVYLNFPDVVTSVQEIKFTCTLDYP